MGPTPPLCPNASPACCLEASGLPHCLNNTSFNKDLSGLSGLLGLLGLLGLIWLIEEFNCKLSQSHSNPNVGKNDKFFIVILLIIKVYN